MSVSLPPRFTPPHNMGYVNIFLSVTINFIIREIQEGSVRDTTTKKYKLNQNHIKRPIEGSALSDPYSANKSAISFCRSKNMIKAHLDRKC